jgi:hypothetical protein
MSENNTELNPFEQFETLGTPACAECVTAGYSCPVSRTNL